MQWSRGKLDFSRGPLVMGVLNVTPDSFSDGGRFLDTATAVERGLQMADQGEEQSLDPELLLQHPQPGGTALRIGNRGCGAGVIDLGCSQPL